MSWTRSDALEEHVEPYHPGFVGDEWKEGVGPRKANFGHSVMGTGGAIHFDHRGRQLPTYRHTPRLLNLLNMTNRDTETITQRDIDEYRRNRDAGKDTGWIGAAVKEEVSDHFNQAKHYAERYNDPEVQVRQARAASGGEPFGGTFTTFAEGWKYHRRGYRPNPGER